MSLTRRILKHMSIFAGVQASGIICAIIRAKIIALWIGPVGVGLNALLTNALNMLTQLFQLGINVSGVRDIAAAESETRRGQIIRALMRWSLILGVIGAIAVFALAPLLSKLTFGTYSNSWMFAILSVGVLASVISAGRQAILQGTECLRRLATLTMTGMIVSTAIAVPLFFWLRLTSIPWVVGVYTIVPALFFLADPMSRRQSQAAPRKVLDRHAASFLRFGVVLTLSNTLTMISGYVVTVFLNRYASTAEVGIYQAGFAIINNYMGILLVAQSVEYFPRLSSQSSHPRRCEIMVSHQLRLMTLLLMVVIPVFLLCRQLIVWLLYSADFYAAIPFLTFAIAGAALRILSSTIAYMMLVRSDSKAYMISELSSSLVGMILNISGYIIGGIAGMGIAYMIWYALYFAAVWAIAHYRYGVHIDRRVIRLMGLGALVAAVSIALAT